MEIHSLAVERTPEGAEKISAVVAGRQVFDAPVSGPLIANIGSALDDQRALRRLRLH